VSFATAKDGVKLYYEDVGRGTPIIFVHEFGGNYRSWNPQVRYFSRRHRCITFAARGYEPSDIPNNVEAYSQQNAASDILAVLDALSIAKAHVVGLSMGGFAALHFGLNYPDRALSLTVAGAGYGAEKEHEEYFRNVSLDVARQFETQGAKVFAETYATGASRVQYQNKDPQGWREFADELARHSSVGAAMTMRGVQARRPSLYDLKDRLSRMTVPTLIMSGDEDRPCLGTGVLLKRAIPSAGLMVFPKTGHTINLEEPGLFNQALQDFFTQVESGRWPARDKRTESAAVLLDTKR
jgi:pimeloyl-ACP methyl ester carboxylesterase